MKVSELKTEMDARFHEVDARFLAVDARFDAVDRRFDAIDQRLDRMDARFDGIDARLDRVDARFDSMNQRISDEAANTRRHFDVVAENLKSQISTLAERVAESTAASDRRLRPVESGQVTLLSALSDHELRLLVLEGARRDQ